MDQVVEEGDVSIKSSDSTCPVCLYSEDCHRKYLNGEVIDIDNEIRVKSDDIIQSSLQQEYFNTCIFSK